MKNNYTSGHIERFWPLEDHKELQYIRIPPAATELSVIEGWIDKGYHHAKNFIGMSFTEADHMPKWTRNFNRLFDTYEKLNFSFLKMQTLDIIPNHVDDLKEYSKLLEVPRDRIVRIIVMLENWKSGHYLEINGTMMTNWIAGDWFKLGADCSYSLANIGTDDFYSMQIMATEVEASDIWTKVHWYNIPDLPTKQSSLTNYLNCRILPSVNKGNPLFIYLWNQRIVDLEKIEHSDETIKHLNKKGVSIYLYEPLCSYTDGQRQRQYNMQFYSEFKDGEDKILFRADELDSIVIYVVRNRLKNVTVYTCDFDVDKYYPYYGMFFKVVTDDLFLKTLVPFQAGDTAALPTFNKKFMCLNWRYTPHRHFIAAHVAPLSSYTSWYFRSDADIIGRTPWTNIFEWEQCRFDKLLIGLEYLNKNAPLSLDLNIDQPTNLCSTQVLNNTKPRNYTIYDYKADNKIPEHSLESYYKDIFCDIVTESRFAQPTANYSEKVLQAMFYKKPFILAAPPKTLHYLKEAGFKTFDKYWDESYDDCYDHEKRLFKIIDLINDINNKPLEELQEMYKEMLPILESNFDVVVNMLKPVKVS